MKLEDLPKYYSPKYYSKKININFSSNGNLEDNTILVLN